MCARGFQVLDFLRKTYFCFLSPLKVFVQWFCVPVGCEKTSGDTITCSILDNCVPFTSKHASRHLLPLTATCSSRRSPFYMCPSGRSAEAAPLFCLHCGHAGLEPFFQKATGCFSRLFIFSSQFWSSLFYMFDDYKSSLLDLYIIYYLNPASWHSPQILFGKLSCSTVTLLCCLPCISSCAVCAFICVFEGLVGNQLSFSSSLFAFYSK